MDNMKELKANYKNSNMIEQAGAELCQAQVS